MYLVYMVDVRRANRCPILSSEFLSGRAAEVVAVMRKSHYRQARMLQSEEVPGIRGGKRGAVLKCRRSDHAVDQ